MGYKTGTSTDYIDMLNDLIEFAVTEAAASAVVAAGGSSYLVNDKITLSGGTFGTAAIFNVDTIDGGGAVLTVSVDTEGDYTATPSNPVTTTGGTGTGCTLTVTWKAKYGWIVKRESQEAVSATVQAGGSNYAVNDKLFLVGGTKDGTYGATTRLNVDTVSGTAVATVSVDSGEEGNYLVVPSDPVATTTDGSGTNCTLNVTWQGVTASDKEVILEGNGGGSDSILVGIRTYNIGSAYNWELAGFTGYDVGNEFQNQAGISPGRWTAAGTAQEGAYVPMNNSSGTYWLTVDSRRIMFGTKYGSAYPNGHLGWLDRLGTSGEYPYPMFICGCSSDATKIFSDTSIGYSGLTDPIGANGDTYGPGFVRSPGGQWRTVRNSVQSGASRSGTSDLVVYPAGTPDTTVVPQEDRPFALTVTWYSVIPDTGNPGSQAIALEQTPDSPNYVSYLVPATLIGADPDILVFGEVRGLFWVSADVEGTTMVSEDTVAIGGDTYRVLQNCNRSSSFSFLCIKQE